MMRLQFTGFLRAVRGERLLGNRPRIASEPCATLREAEEWVAGMLASNIEAGKKIAEAGTRKHGTKTKKRAARQPRAADQTVRRRPRARSANRGAADAAPARSDA